MNVSSFAELLQLHGYGLYVWPAYAAMLAGLLMEPWLIRRRIGRARLAAREQWLSTQLDEGSTWDQTRLSEHQP